MYALIGNTNAAGYFVISSFIEGLGTSANGSFSVANAKEYLPNGQALTGNITGTFSPRATIMGTVQSPSGTASFTGTAPAASSYNYDVATPISAIAGNWSGTSLAGEANPFAITTSGAISGRSALGCTFTGTAAPRASGKNVFDVTITFGPAPCVLPAALVTGGAVTNLIPDGRRQLIVALTNSGRTAGTVIVAQR